MTYKNEARAVVKRLIMDLENIRKNWSINYKKTSENQGRIAANKRPQRKTYPADYRKLAAVDSNKHDWD